MASRGRMFGLFAASFAISIVAGGAICLYVYFFVSMKKAELDAIPEVVTPTDTWEGDGVQVSGFTAIHSDLLMIGLKVRSTKQDARINFRTWADDFGIKSSCSATDSKGNALVSQDHLFTSIQIRNGFEAQNPNIRVGTGAVDPGRERMDLIFFEAPIASATYVDVILKGSNVGLKETIRLRLKV